MHAQVVDWNDRHVGVELELGPREIDDLIRNLGVLRKDRDQHFHISSDSDECRLGDIEISVAAPGQTHNMSITSVALFPGDEIPLPPHGRRTWAGPNPRSIGLWLSWIATVVAGLGAASAAYVTHATRDYRAILVGGVWQSVVALLALHGASLLARGWKTRIPVAILALLILSVLGVILGRLSAYPG